MPTEVKFFGVYGAVWLAALLVLASAIFARRMIGLLRVLMLGRRENRLDHIPLRILTFLKEVMGQSRMLMGESIINWAHPVIFWGFCFFVLASALMFVGGITAPFIPAGWAIPQVEEIPVLGTFVDLFAVIVLIGLVASSIRRYILTPPGLQRTADATIVVLLIAALMVTFLLAEAGSFAEGKEQTWLPAGTATAHILLGLNMDKHALAHVGVVSWWIHVAILLIFLVYLPYSKHMHLMWAPFAVFFAELPQKGQLTTDDDFEAEPATQLGYFTWRQLLSGYACAECGRCDRVCPAVASGAKLSPREILHDIKGLVLKEGFAALKGERGTSGEAFIGGVVSDEVLWDCMTCHACVDICPVRNEHVPIIVQMRRKLVNDGTVDSSLQDALVSLGRYGNSFGQSARKRAQWAKDLDHPVKNIRKEPAEYLWFVGDYASYDQRMVAVTQAIAKVFQKAGLDFGILFEKEQNAGNDVRRVGEEGLFELLREKNCKVLEKAEFQQIITTDPHTYNTLKHEYGAADGLLEDRIVLHYTELFKQLLDQGKLQVGNPLGYTATYHDPCYLGRYNGVYDEPREVLEAIGVTLVEMPRNRENSFCCGAGGGRIWMKDTPGIEERPAENRIKEALSLPGVKYLVVACPKDLVMFQDAVKTVGAEDRLKVVDLGELVFQSIQDNQPRRS